MKEVCCIVKSQHAASGWFNIIKALAAQDIICMEIIFKQPSEVPGGLMAEFYAEHADRPYFARLIESVSGPLVFIAACTEDLSTARLAIGPADPMEARASVPCSIRAAFGTQLPHNAVHLSDSAAAADRELSLLRAHGMLSKRVHVPIDGGQDEHEVFDDALRQVLLAENEEHMRLLPVHGSDDMSEEGRLPPVHERKAQACLPPVFLV